ncbi:hypothetical protein C8J57DRAFT_1231986 [Mycena rebaudengoi]|nr:hypothetical protein C8J57DRAFT_1231986 [Mycena rebaudengoi]
MALEQAQSRVVSKRSFQEKMANKSCQIQLKMYAQQFQTAINALFAQQEHSEAAIYEREEASNVVDRELLRLRDVRVRILSRTSRRFFTPPTGYTVPNGVASSPTDASDQDHFVDFRFSVRNYWVFHPGMDQMQAKLQTHCRSARL